MDQDRRPFCDRGKARIAPENDSAVALPDAFPAASGHTLVVPRRHVARLFDLAEEDEAALWRLVALVRGKLASELRPDGFNVGVNDGAAAGHPRDARTTSASPSAAACSGSRRRGPDWAR